MKSERFWQLFFVFIGAFLSAYVGYYLTNLPQDKTVLTYSYIEGIELNKTLGETGDVTMMYKGEEVKKLTKHLYTVANLSDKDIGAFKLHFEFNNGVYPDFYTISENENIPRKSIRLTSNTEGSYIFEVDFINSVNSVWRGLGFEFYFVGDEKPSIALKSGVMGFSLEKYEYTSPSYFEHLLSNFIKYWWLLVLTVIFFYLMIRYEQQSSLVAEEKLRLALVQAEGTVDETVIKGIKDAVDKQPSFREVIRSLKR